MKHLFALAVAFLILGCTTDSSNDDDQPEQYVATQSDFNGFTNWSLITTRQGLDPAQLLAGGAHGGNDNSVIRTIYQKTSGNRVNGQYAIGTIFLKDMAVNGETMMTTAMAKRGGDFNKNGGGWEYFIMENGQMMRGDTLMGGMCAGCHSAASGNDFVFTK